MVVAVLWSCTPSALSFADQLLDAAVASSDGGPQVGHRILHLLAAALPVLQSTQPMHDAQVRFPTISRRNTHALPHQSTCCYFQLYQAQSMFEHWHSRYPQFRRRL